jgi:hypothetical protein
MDPGYSFTFTLDRRTLLMASAACIPAAALIPVVPAAAVQPQPSISDWSIDDQWSGYPRFADATMPGKPAGAARLSVHPADAAFIPD